MSLLQNNLTVFFERYPESKEKFNSIVQDLDLSRWTVLKNSYLIESGKIIDSPESDFWSDIRFKRLNELKAEKIILVGGFAGGQVLDQIKNSDLKNFEDLIIIEPHIDRFLGVCALKDFRSVFKDQRFHFLVGLSPDECFSEFVRLLRIPERAFRMDAYRFILHPQNLKASSEYFEIVFDEWVAATKQLRRHFGEKEDSLLGFRLFMENLDWVYKTPGVLSLKNLFEGKPAVIISTGPSLKKSLPEIKKVQDKAILIAADASLSILLDAGIEPHFICTLERDLCAKKFFETSSSKKEDLQTSLISYAFIPRESTQAFKGKTWVAYRDYGYFLFFEKSSSKGIISSSTSVAHFCLRIASHLGCGPIVLVGQDLSYDPQTLASHPDGIAYEDWSHGRSLEDLKSKIVRENLGQYVAIEGNDLPEVPSCSLYFSFVKEFAWEATQLKVPLMNATIGGAKIPGLQRVRLEDLARQWSAIPRAFEQIKDKYKPQEGKFPPMPEVYNFIEELETKLKMILQLTNDFEAQNLITEKKSETVNFVRKALEELYKDPRFVCFILQNSGREILEIENEWNLLSDSVQDPHLRMKILRSWLSLIVDVLQQIHALMVTPHSSNERHSDVVSERHGA